MKKILGVLGLAVVILLGSLLVTKNDDNEITIYTAQESEFLDYYLEEFRELHPDIKVNVIKETTGVITAKLLVEKENPQADIIWNVAASSVLVLDEHDALYPYTPKGIEKIDSKFYDTKNDIPTWVGTTAWAGAITVNTKEAEEKGIPIPKSYTDLLDPVYKNEIVMSDPVASGTGFLMISSWLQKNGEEAGWDFIDKLDENVKMYLPSGSAPVRNTAIGEQVIGLGYDKESLNLQKTTPEITTIFPSDGLPWEVEACAIVNKKNVKDEAKIFYEWAVSENAIKKYGENRTLITLKDNDFISEGIPENINERLSENDFIWASDNRNNIISEWAKRYGSR